MLYLGIETSQLQGTIAVCDGSRCLAEATLEKLPGRHTQTLVNQIHATLQAVGRHPRDLDGVAVSIGPGSFTGLRIGVVCAKLLSYATGCSLAAVDTFQAVAANSPADIGSVEIVDDAQRGDLFIGRYERQPKGDWRPTNAIAIMQAAEWSRGPRRVDCVSGPGLSKYAMHVPCGLRVLDQSAWIPRASQVAQIGSRQIEQGQIADCGTLEPFYLRRSAAEERAQTLPRHEL